MSEAVHTLGEVLRSAREASRIEVERIERDTRIRTRYLSALERGQYDELPGGVYTVGFLRSYATYLGLDADRLVNLYRSETDGAAGDTRNLAVTRQRLGVRRSRTFVVSSGALRAGILMLLVGLVAGYLMLQLATFAGTPGLRIVDPPGDLAAFGGQVYVIRGVTAPNARVSLEGLRENPVVTADGSGSFDVIVQLLPGSNLISMVAFDPVTRRDSETVTRTITVTTPATTPASP